VENTKKNTGGASGKGFDVLGQPSPEAKKKGWERRRAAQEIMNIMDDYRKMPYGELKKLIEDVKADPDSHTVQEVKLAGYMSSPKFTIDWLDRHVSKAPLETSLDVTSGGEKITAGIFVKSPTGEDLPTS
jgi:hypothetical protein